MIYQFMKEIGLPYEKVCRLPMAFTNISVHTPNAQNDMIEPSEWTFDKFYQLYHKVCPRNDIEELFKETYVALG